MDALPAFRRGLALTLAERGFDASERALEDASLVACEIIAVTISSASDCDELASLQKRGPTVVALIPDSGTIWYQRALRAGATGAVPRVAGVDEIVSTIDAAAAGMTMLPKSVAHALSTAGLRLVDEDRPISRLEASWLQAISRGATVGELARANHYSERQMHRLIAAAYQHLGATNRLEALVSAAQRGLLD